MKANIVIHLAPMAIEDTHVVDVESLTVKIIAVIQMRVLRSSIALK